MKSSFSVSWKRSSQVRKQRKYQMNAPVHIKGKFLSARLSKELQEKHKMKSLRVRVGDKVKVMRGQFKGKIGAVDKVDLGSSRIYIQKVDFVKKDGSTVAFPVHASNVMIIDVKQDKRRFSEVAKK